MRIFELVSITEDCTHINVYSDADVDTKVIGDLGIMVEVEGEPSFQPQYTSAVIPKADILYYTEPV